MPIDRTKLQAGDILCTINLPSNKGWLENAIKWFTWGWSKRPEGGHIATVYSQTEGAEQFWPCSRKYDYASYDERFDNGEIVVMRPRFKVDAATWRRWVDKNLGTPYGIDDLATSALDGIRARVTPFLTPWLKSRDLPIEEYTLTNDCSQWAWLGLSLVTGYDFAKVNGIGHGQIVPGDYLGLIGKEFDVTQSKNPNFQPTL